MITTTAFDMDACMEQVRPRLSTMLTLMLSEALALGQKTLWLGTVIALTEPLGFQERAIRTALFRLAEHDMLRVERHGRRSLCMLAPAKAAALVAARHRLNIPPERGFNEDWTILVHSGGIGSVHYAAARKRLLALEYCQLAPNLLARPASYRTPAPSAMPAGEEHGLALFDVSGPQLANAVRQPLFGQAECDLEAAVTGYRAFLARFEPLLPLLPLQGRRGAISDEQACMLRLLVIDSYQHCRAADPLLPRDLLPPSWPAMAAYQAYLAIYNGCAAQSRRHILKQMALSSPCLSADTGARRPAAPQSAHYMTA
ncbi:PaaX family transcriptional regulator C-terminal domain-containing protein [Oxalobacteraceae bacterium A2-2]